MRRYIHFATLRSDVCKGVEYVSELVGGQILWLVISPIDGPASLSASYPHHVYRLDLPIYEVCY